MKPYFDKSQSKGRIGPDVPGIFRCTECGERRTLTEYPECVVKVRRYCNTCGETTVFEKEVSGVILNVRNKKGE